VAAIALFASARRHGNTGAFMDRIAAELGIEVVDLAFLDVAPYDYEHRHRGDDFEPLMRRVLDFDRIIFASPVYWYAVSPPMKAFLDRITDFLDLPIGYVVCTSIYDEVPAPFLGAFLDTFDYLGMRFGGMAHANCQNGYDPAVHEGAAGAFARLVRA